jgi:prepilin-type processing-associated H-X9-DG protein
MANYNIIGSDGKEYGPVSAEDLRKWVAEGRADAQSKVRAEGTTEWVMFSEVPELRGAPKPTMPPPLPAHMPAATGKTSVMAILSLVLGVLGLFSCGGTALFGLILGIIAMVKVSNSGGALRGKGLALAGVIVSAVFLLMVPIFAAMLLPALAAAKNKAREINCMNNERQLALAAKLYAGNNNNHYPPAATWCDAIKPDVSLENVFNCPAVNSTDLNSTNRCDYAFNAKLDGMDADKIDPQTVMIFESDTGWDAHGGPEIASTQRHRNFLNVAFADGHVEKVAEARLSSLRWDP